MPEVTTRAEQEWQPKSIQHLEVFATRPHHFADFMPHSFPKQTPLKHRKSAIICDHSEASHSLLRSIPASFSEVVQL